MASKFGHIVTEETRKKISESLKNEKHFNWKEEPTYGIVHYWLRQNFGIIYICEFCGANKKCHWALRTGEKYERKRENFIPLCPTCHKRYDSNYLRTKPKCIDCGIILRGWYSVRCRSHAQKERFRYAKN